MSAQPIKIRINGEPKELDNPLNLEELIQSLRLKREAVVCELNKAVVKREEYPLTRLRDNDSLEIVHFVGGG